ncbi:hypothetical protein HNQ92_004032 [Rhabdobacter roseus]|uniref:Uncharacterized protein n=1 Tax=Rhabdobacter roseus TaxID=1655419 RepID=A0A840TWB7_9BACT|nr:hypothetical protein [Rhabdobacter roseus]
MIANNICKVTHQRGTWNNEKQRQWGTLSSTLLTSFKKVLTRYLDKISVHERASVAVI